MKTNFNKILSVFCSICILTSVSFVPVFAENEPVETTAEQTVETTDETISSSTTIAETKVNVAEVNGTGYATLQEAIAAANNGDTVVILEDIIIEYPTTPGEGLRPDITIDKSLTLDLAGHTIKRNECTVSVKGVPAFFAITEAVDVTITGNGVIDTELGDNSSYGINLFNPDATLTIENGTFLGAPTAFQVQKGTLNVKGGTFDLAASCKTAAPAMAKYIINCIDRFFKDGTAKINVSGGVFAFDPSANPEGENTTYIADGYKAIKSGENFAVVNTKYDTVTYPAMENGLTFATFKEAFDALNENGTIIIDGVDVKASDLVECKGKHFTISFKAEEASELGEHIVVDSNVTLDGLNLDIVCQKGTNPDKKCSEVFELKADLTIKNSTINVDCGNNRKFAVMPKEDAKFEIDHSTLNIKNVRGNATNGSDMTLKNDAKVNLDKAADYGFSVSSLTIEDTSALTVTGTGRSGVYVNKGDLIVNEKATLSVKNCGANLPIENKWSVAKGAIQLSKNAGNAKINGTLILEGNEKCNFIHIDKVADTGNSNAVAAQVKHENGVYQFVDANEALEWASKVEGKQEIVVSKDSKIDSLTNDEKITLVPDVKLTAGDGMHVVKNADGTYSVVKTTKPEVKPENHDKHDKPIVIVNTATK